MLTLTASKVIEIFVDCDDFMISFTRQLQLPDPLSERHGISNPCLSASEVMTLCILYHHSRMDCFKSFYQLVVHGPLRSYFPCAPSYSHFIKLKKQYLFELFAFLWAKRLSAPSPEANFIDSKKLEVCHLKREKQHKVMEGLASKGKTSTGWFYGLKLHLVINAEGLPVRFLVTSGNRSDNNDKVLKNLLLGLIGNFYGDKGYLSKLKAWLKARGATLVTRVRKNMKKQVLTRKERHYLRRRGLIETVFGLLAFQCDIDHNRHRSQQGFFINLFSGLIAYTYLDNLPRLNRFHLKEVQMAKIVFIED